MEGPSFDEFRNSVESLQEIWQFNSPEEPSLVSLKDEKDRIYIARWIEDDGESDFYLYARVNLEQYTMMIKKELDYKSVFKNSIDGFIYAVSVSANGSESVDTVDCEDVDDGLLS